MIIPGTGLGISWFEYSGNGVVVAGRVKFMAVPASSLEIPGLGIPSLAEIHSVHIKYSGGSMTANNGIEGMAILIPDLGSYLSLFMS